MDIGLQGLAPHVVQLSYPPHHNIKQKAPLVGSNLVSCTTTCIAMLEYHHYACKTKIVEPLCAQSNGEPHSKDMIL